MKVGKYDIDKINQTIEKVKSICKVTEDCSDCIFGEETIYGVPKCMFWDMPYDWRYVERKNNE